MHNYILATLPFLVFPMVIHAQTAQQFVINFTTVLNTLIIPSLMALAFLFFVINAVRFFVIGSTSEEGRDKAKALAIYGISAFVLIITFWGIINLLTSSIGLDGTAQTVNDYCPSTGC
jgi:succinate dehydrogenase/fumarate reductase cytochrome b subunit